jgi:hypothetical protein
VDVGQARDPTALAVVQDFAVRWVERVPLGTVYPLVADRIAAVARAAGDAPIAVDAGGVGRAVVDLLRERGFTPIAVTLHGGKAVRRTANGISIPRHAFFRPLEAAVEQNRLRVARGCPGSESLAHELLAARRSGVAAQLEAKGSDHHGDLLVAIALAMWGQALLRLLQPPFSHVMGSDRPLGSRGYVRSRPRPRPDRSGMWRRLRPRPALVQM